ncbi:MAG: hypothetical protein QXX83_08720 [Thermofilum sp.]
MLAERARGCVDMVSGHLGDAVLLRDKYAVINTRDPFDAAFECLGSEPGSEIVAYLAVEAAASRFFHVDGLRIVVGEKLVEDLASAVRRPGVVSFKAQMLYISSDEVPEDAILICPRCGSRFKSRVHIPLTFLSILRTELFDFDWVPAARCPKCDVILPSFLKLLPASKALEAAKERRYFKIAGYEDAVALTTGVAAGYRDGELDLSSLVFIAIEGEYGFMLAHGRYVFDAVPLPNWGNWDQYSYSWIDEDLMLFAEQMLIRGEKIPGFMVLAATEKRKRDASLGTAVFAESQELDLIRSVIRGAKPEYYIQRIGITNKNNTSHDQSIFQ